MTSILHSSKSGLINKDKQILSDKKSPFYLPTLSKGLVAIGKFNQTISVEGISGTYKYLTEQQIIEILLRSNTAQFSIYTGRATPRILKMCYTTYSRHARECISIPQRQYHRHCLR